MTNQPLSEELEVLFRQHLRLVYRTAYYITRSAADAEDVAQGLFLHLVGRGVPPGLRDNPGGYLYRAAVNLSLRTVKLRDRRERAESAHAWLADVQQDGSRETPDLHERLARAIRTLNPRAIQMLVLRYEHDFTDAEIGRLLGTTRTVVAVTLFRARARLKGLLRAPSGDEL